MADIRISQLTELGTAPADSDVLIINDVSVNTTKKITFGNLLTNFAENVIDSASGARCTGDFVIDNELILGGDLTTTAAINAGSLTIDQIDTTGGTLTIGTGLGTATTLKAGQLDTNQIGNLDGSGITLISNLKADDNKEFRVGDGGDGKFYHDGSNTYLEEGGTGSLLLQSNGAGIALRNKSNSLKFVECLTGSGKTTLFYNGGGSTSDQKLETRNEGITVTGESRTDELIIAQDSVGSHGGLIGSGSVPPAASGNTTGKTGQIVWDADFLYIKVSDGANNWKRVALSTFP